MSFPPNLAGLILENLCNANHPKIIRTRTRVCMEYKSISFSGCLFSFSMDLVYTKYFDLTKSMPRHHPQHEV